MLRLSLQCQSLTVGKIQYGERKSKKNSENHRLDEIRHPGAVTRSGLRGALLTLSVPRPVFIVVVQTLAGLHHVHHVVAELLAL